MSQLLVPSKTRKEADELAAAAESACRTVLAGGAISSSINARIAEFEQLAAKAEQNDPTVWQRPQPIQGRSRAEIRSECPGQMKQSLAAAEQQEAAKRAQHERAEAESKARLAELRSRLKGDRRRIFDREGKPFRYEGTVESSSFWRYAISAQNGSTEVDCSVTYTFRGNKIAKKEVARYCPDDPHPGIP